MMASTPFGGAGLGDVSFLIDMRFIDERWFMIVFLGG
jgi:hypothetical protein